MPDDYKDALLSPLLKKHDLELIEKNFRPISNLIFISKLIERCAAEQMNDHMMTEGLYELVQSAYRKDHSCETALLKLENDVCIAMENRLLFILTLLDLSAAFDTVDHAVLLIRLRDRLGFTGAALKWFESYLCNRKQRVKVQNSISDSVELACGVPQGSVLGPLLFTVYTLPLGDLVRGMGFDLLIYADDTQLYITFRPIPSQISLAIDRSADCVTTIKTWMADNFLKCNEDKTDFTIFGTRQLLTKLPPGLCLPFGDPEPITVNPAVKNLGVIFDQSLTFKEHITKVCKSSYFQLHNLRCIRKYLDPDASALAVHAFVTSKLDCCNSLYYGIADNQIKRLQCIQNTAAKLLSGAKKFDHVTPILKELHWLPVRFRVMYKFLTLTYKAIEGSSPVYLAILIDVYVPPARLRSADDRHLLYEPLARKKCGSRAFQNAAPVLWNSLPLEIRSCPSLSLFQAALKTHLFRMAFE